MDNLAALLNQLHPDHYRSVKLSCRTGTPHFLLPEVDFADPTSRIYIEAYLARKEKSQ